MTALVVAFSARCHTDPPPPTAVDQAYLDACKQDVVEFFGAADRGDCAVLGDLAPETAAGQAQCAKFLESWKGKGTTLLEVASAKPDGRNANAVIVTTRVRRVGRVRDMLIRVERRSGRRVLSL